MNIGKYPKFIENEKQFSKNPLRDCRLLVEGKNDVSLSSRREPISVSQRENNSEKKYFIFIYFITALDLPAKISEKIIIQKKNEKENLEKSYNREEITITPNASKFFVFKYIEDTTC